MKSKLHGYKFTIHERLRKLNVNDYEIAIRLLPELCNVTPRTFRNWIYVKPNDCLELPGTAILKMATFFDCSPLEMYAYPFEPSAIKKQFNDAKAEKERRELELITNYDKIG